MPDFESPEIRRVDLASTVLSLHGWGRPDVRGFGWYQPPTEASLDAADRLLELLGAVREGRITELGRRMLALPVHPRLARLLIAAADEGMLETGAAIAALLSERDLVPADRTLKSIGDSDLAQRLDLIGASPQVARLRDELIRIGRGISPKRLPPHDPGELLLRLPLLAYPDRVCRRRESDPAAGVMVGGGGVRLAAESVVRRHDFFVAIDARQDDRSTSREALVRIASGIDPAWLAELFPERIRQQRIPVYDAERDRVVAHGTMTYCDLVLREDKDAPVTPEDARRVLVEWVRPRVAELLASDDRVSRWMNRLAILRLAMPEQNWPAAPLEAALVHAVVGKRSVAEIRAAMPATLESLLEYPLDRMFQTEAPETIDVPSGSRIRLEYPAQSGQGNEIAPPVLAVRLQEVFGWTQTPCIASGRVPILLHLLAPNFRPVQVTRDLRSFWSTTYFQVRKDLRVRYPKHAWPDDPLTATPQAKGGRRR